MELGDWVNSDLYNGRIVRVANSFVFKEPVYNYSADFPFLWDEIVIPIKHGSDHGLARGLIERVALEVVRDYADEASLRWQEMQRRYRIENASTEPRVFLIVNDNWLEFTLRYVVAYKVRRATKDLLFSRLLDEFAQTERRVQIASTTLEVVAVPPLEVRLRRDA
jgi:small-conductance mechanosensitive channel